MKIALIQLLVGSNKAENVRRAVGKIAEAAANGAKLVLLPECFNSPYGTQYFEEYAEPIPGETTNVLAQAAKDHKIFLFGGSIPERHDSKLYNTMSVFNTTGSLLCKFRKLHLFDINVPGGIQFKESDKLTAGNSPTVVETDFARFGLGICYDCRFIELAKLYAKNGCKVLVYPGAFNMTTGPVHWELMARSMAALSQCYVLFCSPARDTKASYVAWSHSMVVDPWGTVVVSAKEEEAIIYADIDMEYVDKVRQSIPLLNQRRSDIYEIADKTKVNICSDIN